MRLSLSKKRKFNSKIKPIIKFKPTNKNNFIITLKKVYNLNQTQVNELINIINKQKEESVDEPEKEQVVESEKEPIVEREKEQVVEPERSK